MIPNLFPAKYLGRWRFAVALVMSLAVHGLLVVVLAHVSSQEPRGPSANTPCEIRFCCLDEGEESEAPPAAVVAQGTLDPGPITEAVLRTPTSPAKGEAIAPEAKSTSQANGNPSVSAGHEGKGLAAGAGVATTFFDIAARGQKIVYVLDASASMGQGGAWQAARRELLASLRQLPPQVCFQIIVYNRFASFLLPHRPTWLPATAAYIDEAAKSLANLTAEGKTEHGPALQRALALQPDVLFFLTDADDLTAEHLRLAATRNRGGAVIHTIELNLRNRHQYDMPMQQLARQHRGEYRAVHLEP